MRASHGKGTKRCERARCQLLNGARRQRTVNRSALCGCQRPQPHLHQSGSYSTLSGTCSGRKVWGPHPVQLLLRGEDPRACSRCGPLQRIHQSQTRSQVDRDGPHAGGRPRGRRWWRLRRRDGRRRAGRRWLSVAIVTVTGIESHDRTEDGVVGSLGIRERARMAVVQGGKLAQGPGKVAQCSPLSTTEPASHTWPRVV